MVRSVLRTPGVCGGGVEEEAPVRRLVRGSVHSSFPPHPPLHAFSRYGEYVRSRFNCCEYFGFRLVLFVGMALLVFPHILGFDSRQIAHPCQPP